MYPENDYREYLKHHGVKGQRWGVQNGPPYPLDHEDASVRFNSIVSKIKEKVDADSTPPVGNQNCQICTWCTEAQMRGINVLPRPVYSPRDIIFDHEGYEIVKNPVKKSISSMNEVKKMVQKDEGSRYYAHVGWKGVTGGHEFVVANINGVANVVDSQCGLVAPIDSKNGSYYFKNADFGRSFVVRMDNKELNKDILKYNDKKYLIEWDDDVDYDYLENLKNH